MIPANLLGVLVFAASVGPGWVFVSTTERRAIRAERSALLEAAELVAVGAGTSALSLLAALVLARATNWVDLTAFADDGTRYSLQHPARGLLFLVVVLGAAYIAAWGLALWTTRNRPPAITPETVWLSALSDARRTRYVRATVGLRDGRQLGGSVKSFSVTEGSSDHRDIALVAPLYIKAGPTSDWAVHDAHSLLVRGSEIALISIEYQPR